MYSKHFKMIFEKNNEIFTFFLHTESLQPGVYFINISSTAISI